jgi:dihydroflavonol-4-reductase
VDEVLVTGATSFLGYHVAKQLNEQGIRPRVLELPGSDDAPLARLDVERSEGDLEDSQALGAACTGVDTVLHLAFKVGLGGGEQIVREMRRLNVAGTRRVLDSAEAHGVTRVVVSGSALAVGVNRRPVPLDETASWSQHAFDVAYATSRRDAEHEALARARSDFAVVSVCPSFTLGPDDPVGAPANKLIESLVTRKLRFTLPVGFGCLDVRDFAAGVLAASGLGRPGQRYLLNGHNVTAGQLLEQAAAVASVPVPRFAPPRLLLEALAFAVEIVNKVRRRPPPVDRRVLQIIGRYAWYDTARAREDLGWQPRPLRETLEDTIRWLRREAE